MQLTASQINLNCSFDGSPLKEAVHRGVESGLSAMGDRPFSEADVRERLAAARERLAQPPDDPTCRFELQARANLSRDAAGLEALLGFMGEHAGEVLRLDANRPKPLTWGELGERTVEVPPPSSPIAQRSAGVGDAARAQTLAGHCMRASAPFVGRDMAAWQPDDPVRRMHAAAAAGRRAIALGEPSSLTVRAAVGDVSLDIIRRGTAELLDLVQAAHHGAPTLAEKTRPRIDALRAFLATLPNDLASYLPGDSRWAPYQPATLPVAKRQELLKTFAAVQEVVALPSLIRDLRKVAPDVVASAPFQRKLEASVASGREHLAFDLSILDAAEPLSLASFFSYTMPANGVDATVDPLSAPTEVIADKTWLVSLFGEILRNAREATTRRRIREGTYRSNHFESPLVRIEPLDGRVRVTVVDGGEPADYRAHAMLGGSDPAQGGREGFGIGRLRIRLIAEYLGYSVAHRPLRDGRGSGVEVEIPFGSNATPK